jgi:hypothetical protein
LIVIRGHQALGPAVAPHRTVFRRSRYEPIRGAKGRIGSRRIKGHESILILREKFRQLIYEVGIQPVQPIQGLGHFVNGKTLARASELLDTLAEKSGTKPLMKFWSADPEEMSESAAGLGVTLKNNAKLFPSEQWFPAAEG